MGAGKLGPIIAIHGHTAGAHATARDTVSAQPPEGMNRAPEEIAQVVELLTNLAES
jgi:hypothetical protein